MPLYTSEALILRTYKLGEADRIVVFLTRDRGKRRGVAKGARRARSNFGGALEPLTRAGVTYYESERRELVSLNYAEAERSPLASHDPLACAYAEYFAELIDEWAPEGDPSEMLFRLASATLDALAADVPAPRLARYFEYWLLRLQGVYPGFKVCPGCRSELGREAAVAARWVPSIGQLVCEACLTSGRAGAPPSGPMVSSPAVRFLIGSAGVGPERVGQLELAPGAGRELESLHRVLITTHLDREPRSARVLRELGPS